MSRKPAGKPNMVERNQEMAYRLAAAACAEAPADEAAANVSAQAVHAAGLFACAAAFGEIAAAFREMIAYEMRKDREHRAEARQKAARAAP
jgi:hypothetical protein